MAACIDGGCTDAMVSQDICEGDVVFRSDLKDGDWRLENLRHLHLSWPDIVQRF